MFGTALADGDHRGCAVAEERTPDQPGQGRFDRRIGQRTQLDRDQNRDVVGGPASGRFLPTLRRGGSLFPVYFAQCDPEEVAARGITTTATQVRASGYATAVGELEDELVAVAAPVFDTGGRCVAALSVSGPAFRLTPDSLPELGRLCASAQG